MMNKRLYKGFTILEILVVTSIIATLLAVMMIRFNTYEARRACKCASNLLMSDLKYLQQRAVTLEEIQGITFSPGGNSNIYKLWKGSSANVFRVVDFRELFHQDVYFDNGLRERELQFYPWTSSQSFYWSVSEVKMGVSEVNDIFIFGGGISCKISYENGRFVLYEGN